MPSPLRLACCCTLAITAAAAPKPHLVVYLVDDLGYHDVHFGGSLDPHNSDMHTPALVELAAQGIILGRHCEPQPDPEGAAASPWPLTDPRRLLQTCTGTAARRARASTPGGSRSTSTR